MKIPKTVRAKMHRVAKLCATANELSAEIDKWFENHGFDIDKLRCGDGYSLEELEYGNDVTDRLCGEIEQEEQRFKKDDL